MQLMFKYLWKCIHLNLTFKVKKLVCKAYSFHLTGIFCSSYFWGYLSDSIGRRPVLIYTTFSGSLVSLLSIFIPTYWIYVVLRFIVGFL